MHNYYAKSSKVKNNKKGKNNKKEKNERDDFYDEFISENEMSRIEVSKKRLL